MLKRTFFFCLIVNAISIHRAKIYGQQNLPSFRQYIEASVPEKKEIDIFLNDDSTWAQFDSELGYVLGNSMPKDGQDKSATLSSVQPNLARTSYMYTSKPCRINSYGNSFTQCHQVSDGETWQEYLAAHLGEPIRNYGMGGYGSYQAYRRLLREERTKNSAEYLLFYIWGDDHIRSLLRCRYLTFPNWTKTMAEREGVGKMFHNNFWPHLQMDLASGKLVERPNLLPTRKSLYKMTDPAWVYQHVKDDLAMQMLLFSNNVINDFDTANVIRLAKHLQIVLRSDDPEMKKKVKTVLYKYSFAATKYTLDKLKTFAERKGKKLKIILLDPTVLFALSRDETRYEQEIVDYLKEKNFDYFDMNLVHLNDYRDNFKVGFETYYKRFFIGHYSPAGNHFFAFAIKNDIVKWLNPKPVTYREAPEENINFDGYLESQKK